MNLKSFMIISIVLTTFLTFGQDTPSPSSPNNTVDQTSLKPSDSIKQKELRDVPWFVERFRISAGFYTQLNNTTVNVQNGSGNIDFDSDINFEKDLGFNDKSQSFIADLEWRSSSRSRFNVSYYEIKRNSDYRLQKSFDFNGQTYNINTEVYAYFNSSIVRFSYGYAILSKPKYELGLLVGTHTNTISVGIGAVGENANLEANQSYKLTAPLVDLGLWGGYALGDRWALRGEFNYFQIGIGNIKGQVLGYNFNVVYKVLKNLELTTGLSGLNYKIDESNDTLNSDIRWNNNGMFLMAAYTFGNKNWK